MSYNESSKLISSISGTLIPITLGLMIIILNQLSQIPIWALFILFVLLLAQTALLTISIFMGLDVLTTTTSQKENKFKTAKKFFTYSMVLVGATFLFLMIILMYLKAP